MIAPKKSKKPKRLPQDFKSVAKRLGCDPSMENFDAKLEKIVKAKSTVKKARSA